MEQSDTPEEITVIAQLTQEIAYTRGKLVEKDGALAQLLAIEQVRQAENQAMLRAYGEIAVRMSGLQAAVSELVNRLAPGEIPNLGGDFS